MSNAQDLGTASSIGGNFTWEGLNNNYNVIVNPTIQGNASITTQGTANTQNFTVVTNTLFKQDTIDVGYGINYGGIIADPTSLINNPYFVDNQQYITWPKDQQIYYKLVGYNTQTQLFETWIITEEIIPRPELFDPTRNPPSIDYNVYFAPPSGNKLSNIKIVGRWIQ
jgi:hypothetical protein